MVENGIGRTRKELGKSCDSQFCLYKYCSVANFDVIIIIVLTSDRCFDKQLDFTNIGTSYILRVL